jgi:hypothetical protein
MSKRLVVKLAVMMTALSAVTLLSGCGEDDDVVFGAVWMPCIPGVTFGSAGFATSTGATGGGGQAASAGVVDATAGAVAGAVGTAGGQVSGGAVQ